MCLSQSGKIPHLQSARAGRARNDGWPWAPRGAWCSSVPCLPPSWRTTCPTSAACDGRRRRWFSQSGGPSGPRFRWFNGPSWSIILMEWWCRGTCIICISYDGMYIIECSEHDSIITMIMESLLFSECSECSLNNVVDGLLGCSVGHISCDFTVGAALQKSQHGDDFLMISTIDGTWMVAYDYNKLLCLLIWEALRSPTLLNRQFSSRGYQREAPNQSRDFIHRSRHQQRRTKKCRASSAKIDQNIIGGWQEWFIKNKSSLVFCIFFSPRIQQKYGALHREIAVVHPEVAGSLTDTRDLCNFFDDLTAILE